MKRSAIPRRPSRPQLRSAQLYALARKEVWARENDLCAVCSAPGEQVHHRLPRGMGGDRASSALSRLLLLCAACHQRVESHREHAMQLGLLVPRGKLGVQNTEQARVFYRGRWCRLTDDGYVIDLE